MRQRSCARAQGKDGRAMVGRTRKPSTNGAELTRQVHAASEAEALTGPTNLRVSMQPQASLNEIEEEELNHVG